MKRGLCISIVACAKGGAREETRPSGIKPRCESRQRMRRKVCEGGVESRHSRHEAM